MPYVSEPGARVTAVLPGLIARAGEAVRYVITGVAPATWFGPMQPLKPVAPESVAGAAPSAIRGCMLVSGRIPRWGNNMRGTSNRGPNRSPGVEGVRAAPWMFGVLAATLVAAVPVTRPAVAGINTLYSFCSQINQEECEDGSGPIGTLVTDGSNFYGVTVGGGSGNSNNGGGTIFELTNNNGTYSESVLYNFCSSGESKCTDGTIPRAGLSYDGTTLFGTTEYGGANGYGVAFEFVPGSGTYKVLYNFCSDTSGSCHDGGYPEGTLFDSNGALYGTTAGGGAHAGGTVFKLTAGSGGLWNEQVLYSFCAKAKCADGATPQAGVIVKASDSIFGTTSGGGKYNSGTLFVTGIGHEFVLQNFCSFPGGRYNPCLDGVAPVADLFGDGSSVYGTAQEGGWGNPGYGVTFSFNAFQGGFRVLSRFCSPSLKCSGGLNPVAGLAFDGTNLYGTTYSSMCSSLRAAPPLCGSGGALFQTDPKTGSTTTLYYFGTDDKGNGPAGGVIVDSSGNIFGTTANGGKSSCGCGGEVWEYSPGKPKHTHRLN